MLPKDKKKKPAKKPPAYQTGEAELAPFGVKVGQLVRNSLGCTGAVLGIRPAVGGTPELWVRYEAGGLEAPMEAAGLQPCPAAQQLRLDIQQRQQEQRALDEKWRAYNDEQARKAAEAQKAAARKMKQKAAAAEAAAGAAAPPSATAEQPQGGEQAGPDVRGSGGAVEASSEVPA